METIIYIVISLSLLSIGTKLSLSKWWLSLAYGFFYSIFLFLIKDFAINSNRNQIQEYLISASWHSIVAIVVTIELFLLFFCIFNSDKKAIKAEDSFLTIIAKYIQRIFYYINKYYITSLVLISLFIIETYSIFAFIGLDFDIIVLFVSIGVFLWCLLSGILFKFLLPIEQSRRDFNLLITILICAVSLYSTNSEVMIYRSNKANHTELASFVMGLGLMLFLITLGIIWSRYRTYNHKQQ